MSQKVLLNYKEVNIILHRLACQLIEKHTDFSSTVLIGLQPRGIFLAQRLKLILIHDYNIPNIQLGLLDITFYRDDFRRSDKLHEANSTEIDFLIENKHVVFIDDVLYTGRSIRSALTAIQSFGRPAGIELLTLIVMVPVSPASTHKMSVLVMLNSGAGIASIVIVVSALQLLESTTVILKTPDWVTEISGIV